MNNPISNGQHIGHWIAGGETNLENRILICKRHHRLVHEGGCQLIRTDHGEIVTLAPRTDFATARGPD